MFCLVYNTLAKVHYWAIQVIKLLRSLIFNLFFFLFWLTQGNGPSGITLSYMLAGNWPYWNPQEIAKHPDELLRARLTCSDPNKSLVEQDLVQLAEGLEGRSTNPVSLLVGYFSHYTIIIHLSHSLRK